MNQIQVSSLNFKVRSKLLIPDFSVFLYIKLLVPNHVCNPVIFSFPRAFKFGQESLHFRPRHLNKQPCTVRPWDKQSPQIASREHLASRYINQEQWLVNFNWLIYQLKCTPCSDLCSHQTGTDLFSTSWVHLWRVTHFWRTTFLFSFGHLMMSNLKVRGDDRKTHNPEKAHLTGIAYEPPSLWIPSKDRDKKQNKISMILTPGYRKFPNSGRSNPSSRWKLNFPSD